MYIFIEDACGVTSPPPVLNICTSCKHPLVQLCIMSHGGANYLRSLLGLLVDVLGDLLSCVLCGAWGLRLLAALIPPFWGSFFWGVSAGTEFYSGGRRPGAYVPRPTHGVLVCFAVLCCVQRRIVC